jgi:hypothetical protein
MLSATLFVMFSFSGEGELMSSIMVMGSRGDNRRPVVERVSVALAVGKCLWGEGQRFLLMFVWGLLFFPRDLTLQLLIQCSNFTFFY